MVISFYLAESLLYKCFPSLSCILYGKCLCIAVLFSWGLNGYEIFIKPKEYFIPLSLRRNHSEVMCRFLSLTYILSSSVVTGITAAQKDWFSSAT